MGSEYTVVLVRMILESASDIGGNEFIITANERDQAYINKNLNTIKNELEKTLGKITIKLEEESIDITGGVIIRNKDATKTYYNTLKGKLTNVRSRIEANVAETLGVI
jgi:vacuolar-type H+-ATPase subunit E/Vma4